MAEVNRSITPFTAQQDERRNKIVAFEDLERLRARFADRTIVQCHGAFDLVHIGHLKHLEEARSLGDILVVTITADRYITKKRSVTFSESDRARQVAALEIVDYVALVPESTALSAIEALHPDYYALGPEYADLTLDKSRSVYHEMRVLEGYGGRMHFTSGETFSSTKLSHFLLSAPEASQRDPLLRNEKVLFKDSSSYGFKLEQLKHFLAQAARLRVAVIGETIVDEWVDVSLTTLSTQSRCVAGMETARVRQVGGLGIIAQHLAHFVEHVDCYTNHIEAAMPPNVTVNAVAPGRVIETRFVDRETGHAVFKTRNRTLGAISLDPLPAFDDYDLVLIADFGHGMLDAEAINRQIAAHKRAVVGVMAQVNSGNYGYNLPIKYTGADYYAVNRTEAELCVHQRGLPLPALLDRTSQVLNASAIAVTDGQQGAMVQSGGVRFQLPSLSVSVVDTIGCGDAFFALSGAALAAGLPANIVALAGSIGAAAMTQRRCNESPVTETEFLTIGKIVI